MPALDLWAEYDTVTECRHAVAQLYVFDGRSTAGLIESAAGREHSSSYGPAPGPEGDRIARITLMHVAMEQVPVLADQPFDTRMKVISSEHGAHVRLALEHLQESPQSIGMGSHVGVDENQQIATGNISTPVAGERWSARSAGQPHYPVSVLRCEFDR
jgi:hypothetical protein